MRTKILALLAGVAIGLVGVAGAGVVQAEKPDATGVPLHRHYFFAASGDKVYIGPNICELPMSEQGWAAFHLMVHRGQANENLQIQAESCN